MDNRKQIEQIDRYQFRIFYPRQTRIEPLNLNFKPLVWDDKSGAIATLKSKNIGFNGYLVLNHWQAKPFGVRGFGFFCLRDFYDVPESSYFSLYANEVDITVPPILLSVDETLYSTVPTAVLLYPNSILKPLDTDRKLWRLEKTT